MYNERVEELNSATQERDNLKNQYDDLKKRRQVYLSLINSCKPQFNEKHVIYLQLLEYYFIRLDEFMSGFNIISLKLKEMYQVRKAF